VSTGEASWPLVLVGWDNDANQLVNQRLGELGVRLLTAPSLEDAVRCAADQGPGVLVVGPSARAAWDAPDNPWKRDAALAAWDVVAPDAHGEVGGAGQVLPWVEVARAKQETRELRQSCRAELCLREDVMGHVIHDLKNRLASILPNAQFVQGEESLSEDARAACADIVSSAHAMHRMAVNVVDLCRAESAGLALHRRPVELAALLRDVTRSMGPVAKGKDQHLVVAGPPGLTLEADGGLLRRALEVLVENACLHGPHGSTVALRVEAGDAEVVFRVEDDGAVVPLEARPTMFDRSAQLSQAGKPWSRLSPGLALVFCRLAVRAHGGELAHGPREPHGAEFTVRLPAASPSLPGV
jgi:signal transduction histidine kinase